MLRKAIPLIVALGICSVFGSAGEAADPAAVKRVELHRSQVPNTNYDMIVTRVEVQPSTKIGLHTHPGFESGYALSGSLTVEVMGQAATKLSPGDTFLLPANAPHVIETGPQGYAGIHTYVVDRTQPIVVMAK